MFNYFLCYWNIIDKINFVIVFWFYIVVLRVDKKYFFLFMEKNFKKNKYIKIFVYVLKYFFDRRFCMFFGY